MKVKFMSDEKILEIKDFKKINGEVTDVSGKKRKAKKKVKKNTKEPEDQFEFYAEELTLEEQFVMIIEENEYLRTELVRENSRCNTLEKLLNKLLKQNKKL